MQHLIYILIVLRGLDLLIQKGAGVAAATTPAGTFVVGAIKAGKISLSMGSTDASSLHREIFA